MYINFVFVDIEYELASLRTFLRSLESHLEVAPDIEGTRLWEELRAEGAEDDEAEVAMIMAQIQDVEQVVLPRLFRGSFLVMLWAVLESGLERIADFAQKENNHPFRMRDVQGRDFLDQAKTYFEKMLNVPLSNNPTTWQALQVLHKSRIAMAHDAGNLSQESLKAFRAWKSQGIAPTFTEDRQLLVLSKEDAATALELVDEFLRDVMRQLDPQHMHKRISPNDART